MPRQFDQLLVDHVASLDGTLHVKFIDGFVAHAGDSFAFLVAGTRLGSFASVEVTGLDPLLRFNISYDANGASFEVQTVPEPQTWAMLRVGLIVLGIGDGRRKASGVTIG